MLSKIHHTAYEHITTESDVISHSIDEPYLARVCIQHLAEQCLSLYTIMIAYSSIHFIHFIHFIHVRY